MVDERIDRALSTFGAVCIRGPKFCGKTWTSRNHANSEFLMTPQNKRLAEISPDYALKGESPHLIDEWQLLPELWDDIRFEVDKGPGKGRYLLTGSSTPPLSKKDHSGIGRIGDIEMRTMSLFESGDSTGAVSLKSLFLGNNLEPMSCGSDLEDLIRCCIRGGWPELIDSDADIGLFMADYLGKLCSEDVVMYDGKRRDPHKMAMLVRSLARNESTTVGDTTLIRDMAENDSERISDVTLADYKNVLRRLNILHEQPAFDPNFRSS